MGQSHSVSAHLDKNQQATFKRIKEEFKELDKLYSGFSHYWIAYTYCEFEIEKILYSKPKIDIPSRLEAKRITIRKSLISYQDGIVEKINFLKDFSKNLGPEWEFLVAGKLNMSSRSCLDVNLSDPLTNSKSSSNTVS